MCIMKKARKYICAALIVIAALTLMSGCAQQYEKVVDLTISASDAAELADLDRFYNLQSLDLRGSDCYDAILDYAAAHPEVEVKYDVLLGETRYAQDTKELTFYDGEYDFDQLLQNIAYLPELTSLDLPQTSLSAEDLEKLETAYPGIKINYTISLLGEEVAKDVITLDLSYMEPGQVDEAIAPLSRLSSLEEIRLTGADGQNLLAPADVKKLMDALPGVPIHYSFDLFGKTVSTADERVEYVLQDIGEEAIPQIRQALDIMPACTYFKLDRCGIGTPEMVKLREDYPNVKMVWRIDFGPCNCLTDVEMIHCTEGIGNDDVQELKYCTDVKYLDLGHNGMMSDISFIGYMPKLKIAIIADSSTSTLEPFRNCPELERLEIVNCDNLTDLSPLADCKKLKGLNMSCAYGIKELSPLYGLKDLERLYLGANGISDEEIAEAAENMPDCWITKWAIKHKEVSGNYAIGWRLERDGTRSDWYVEVREIFRYDEGYFNYND